MSRISSLRDLEKKPDEDSKENEYFAGGLDQRGGGSGLAVVGPPGDRGTGPGLFENIVQRASNPGQAGAAPLGENSTRRVITMYRNGFTVDDGPLRDLASPESREFIASLERGEAPAELRGQQQQLGQPVEVALNDKRGEDYVAPPPPAYIPFSGTGATLGAAGGNAFVFTAQLLSAVPVPALDESAPVTTLQVKTVNGKKIKIRINQSATVRQLAALIVREGGTADAFALSAGFPPKDVLDDQATVAEAGLLNAAVTQRSA